MRLWYLTEENSLRRKTGLRFGDNGKGELTVYRSVNDAKIDVYKDKLEGSNYPHDDFTFEEMTADNGTVTIIEKDNMHSDWYSDPGIEKTIYKIIPFEFDTLVGN